VDVTVKGLNVAGGPARSASQATRQEVVSVLTWKLRISVLWIFLAVCQLAGFAVLMFAPEVIRGLTAGELWGVNTHSAGVQINAALFFLVPMVMAYLTLALNDAASRWANAVLCAVAAVFGISTLIGHPAGTSTGVTFVAIVISLVALLIVWHVWKWPRGAEVTLVTPPRPSLETARR
jgi:hypothetical protein